MTLRITIRICAVVLSTGLGLSAFGQGGTGRETTASKRATPSVTHPIRPARPNPAAPPFTKKGLVDALGSGDSQTSLVREIRRRGVNFDLTDAVESELTAAGAQPPLINAVADNFKSNAVRGGVLAGKAIRLVQPPYPPMARSARVSGQVQVQITVDEEGNVIDAEAISGHPLLHGAAVAAARASKFTPTKLSGQPVKVTGILSYNFVGQ